MALPFGLSNRKNFRGRGIAIPLSGNLDLTLAPLSPRQPHPSNSDPFAVSPTATITSSVTLRYDSKIDLSDMTLLQLDPWESRIEHPACQLEPKEGGPVREGGPNGLH